MTPLFDTIRLHKPLASAELSETSTPEQLESFGPDVKVYSTKDTVTLLPYEIEQIKAEAYAAGQADAAKQLEVSAQQERESRNAALQSSLAELSKLQSDLVQEFDEVLPELLIEAAGRLLAGWVPQRADVESIVDELLEDFNSGDHAMRIHLNPTTLETLTDAGVDAFVRQNPGLEFVADPKLQPGESTLDGRFGLADARFSAKLKNLKEVLNHE